MTATDVGPGGAVESKGLKSGALGLMAATALLRARINTMHLRSSSVPRPAAR